MWIHCMQVTSIGMSELGTISVESTQPERIRGLGRRDNGRHLLAYLTSIGRHFFNTWECWPPASGRFPPCRSSPVGSPPGQTAPLLDRPGQNLGKLLRRNDELHAPRAVHRPSWRFYMQQRRRVGVIAVGLGLSAWNREKEVHLTRYQDSVKRQNSALLHQHEGAGVANEVIREV